MNVLTIGNGFTTDCHKYLPDIFESMGKEIYLANMFLPGGSLENHYRSLADELEVYALEAYLPKSREFLRPTELALHEVVEDEDWDVIIFQQSTPLSGVKESYTPYLEELSAYCSLMKPKARLMLHQVPSYGTQCKAKAFFECYQGNQKIMDEAIATACVEAAAKAEIDTIIPNGAAWQKARSTAIGDRLTTNGYHGNEAGNYLSACVFYKALTGESALNIKYELKDFDRTVSRLLKICAD